MSKKLIVKNLAKKYDEKTAVKNINMEFNTGEIIGLIGPNGAGKTTLFYMITGLIKPTKGQVFFDDKNITNLPIYKRANLGIGYLPQEASIFRGLTVEENILAVLEMHPNLSAQKDVILNELLEEFSLTKLRNSISISLSGGERRRLEIARCVALSPKIVLLDEPMAGIDPISIKNMQKLIRQLKKRGVGVVISDHNVHAALEVIDRGYVIYDGEVLMSGTSKDIVNSKEVRDVYLGNDF